MGCVAAPSKQPRSCRQHALPGFGTASQPNAGQARSPQGAGSQMLIGFADQDSPGRPYGRSPGLVSIFLKVHHSNIETSGL
ncbi:hypothetical protein BFW87_28475 [Pseudomonas fluorescens]|uniref:Uncharacterized protein n=1 Tax=Pseudomonas fluorescens TaxID=294 RepID=A0A1T2XY55_PSEFL|nr:hypothetical protein BFW87_28475 [Pseudomonas fluorescens]